MGSSLGSRSVGVPPNVVGPLWAPGLILSLNGPLSHRDLPPKQILSNRGVRASEREILPFVDKFNRNRYVEEDVKPKNCVNYSFHGDKQIQEDHTS